jgi:uncharacterized membrane-anchored protein
MNVKLLALAGVILLQSAWMLGTAAVQERNLAAGKVVMLETRPVDPRDLLRGDYVILNYIISTIPREQFTGASATNLLQGQTVYVQLEPRGEFYEVAQASTDKLIGRDEYVVLKGLVDHWSRGSTNSVRVKYGLERYYVREGTGDPTGKVTVAVAVPDSGHGLIKQVYVDGHPYAEAMKHTRR